MHKLCMSMFNVNIYIYIYIYIYVYIYSKNTNEMTRHLQFCYISILTNLFYISKIRHLLFTSSISVSSKPLKVYI